MTLKQRKAIKAEIDAALAAKDYDKVQKLNQILAQDSATRNDLLKAVLPAAAGFAGQCAAGAISGAISTHNLNKALTFEQAGTITSSAGRIAEQQALRK